MVPPAASPLAMPSMFADASFDCLDWVGLPPPNPPPHTTELTAEPTCGLPPLSLSPASNARLVATTTMPATALLSRPLFLLRKACEMFLQNASMQSSRDGSYGPALRGGAKIQNLRRLIVGNGISTGSPLKRDWNPSL